MIISESQQSLSKFIYLNNDITTSPIISEFIENGIGSVALHSSSFHKLSPNTKATLTKADQQLQIIHKLQHSQFTEIFDNLSNNNIPFLVLKGWALSYVVYPFPHQRPKTDIDILIHPDYRNEVKRIFESHGFSNPRGWEPKTIIDQFNMRKEIVKGIYANADIHLAITNDKLIQEQLSWDVVCSRSSWNERLKANTPALDLLLVHAVVHMLHHYSQGDMIKLIWLYDTHLIVNQLNEIQIDKLVELLRISGLNSVVNVVLVQLNLIFPSKGCSLLLKRLDNLPINNSFSYLLEQPSTLNSFKRRLYHTKGIKNKLALLRETFLPNKKEIYRKYGKVNNFVLPFMYLKRIYGGIKKNLYK